MEQFYFQVAIAICAALITSFTGWIAWSTWQTTIKIAEIEVKSEIFGRFITDEITKVSTDVSYIRRFEAALATQATQINGLDRRMTNIEHRPVVPFTKRRG